MNRLSVLLTRMASGNVEFAAALRAELAYLPGEIEIIKNPLLGIRPIEPEAWPDYGDALAFTSRNGVEALAARQPGAGRLAFCVGARTGQAAVEAGFVAKIATGTVEDLLRLIVADPPEGRLWYLHGMHRRGDLCKLLSLMDISCSGAAIYDQLTLPLGEAVKARIARGERMVAPLFSPRTAQILATATKNDGANLRVVALSEAVGTAWPYPCQIAERPDALSMIEAVRCALVEAG